MQKFEKFTNFMPQDLVVPEAEWVDPYDGMVTVIEWILWGSVLFAGVVLLCMIVHTTYNLVTRRMTVLEIDEMLIPLTIMGLSILNIWILGR